MRGGVEPSRISYPRFWTGALGVQGYALVLAVAGLG